MRKSNRLNVLLMEIVIAILFFALASTVILRVYASTRSQSVAADLGNTVQTQVQNLSEECYAAEDPAAVLLDNGFAEGEAGYVYEGENYRITAVIETEKTESGVLRTVQFTADVMGETSLTLPSVRYIPEVAAQ